MGLDLGDLFQKAKDQVNAGLEQAKAVGIPALESAGEKWAANTLSQWTNQLSQSAASKDKVVQAEVKKIIEAPSTPGSFGSFLSSTLTGAGVGAESGKILMVVGGLLLVGYFMARK